MADSYDVIIIGAGCAGLSAAMYSGRFGRKTVVLGEMPGGTITTTHIVENYPPIKSISGLELGNKFLEHAKAYGVPVNMERVEKIEKKGDGFLVKTGSAEYNGKTVIYATGTEWRKIGVPGEAELANRGVHYCALCDGAFYKGKKIVVVGSGDSAAKESNLLAEYGSNVYILVRGEELKGERINHENALKNPKIEIFTKVEAKEFLGKEKLEKIKLSRAIKPKGAAVESDVLAADAVFVLVGHVPKTELVRSLGVELDKKGEIAIDKMARTNLPGFFAAGDCCNTEFKQAIVSAAEGVSAAYAADEYLKGKK
ncbi:MAG: FAD-dependent oxidoreductase [Candidatus Micrarchaeota archaeon]